MIERLDQMTYSVRMDKLGKVSYIAFFFLENRYDIYIKYH